jgi:hypothetical protein
MESNGTIFTDYAKSSDDYRCLSYVDRCDERCDGSECVHSRIVDLCAWNGKPFPKPRYCPPISKCIYCTLVRKYPTFFERINELPKVDSDEKFLLHVPTLTHFKLYKCVYGRKVEYAKGSVGGWSGAYIIWVHMDIRPPNLHLLLGEILPILQTGRCKVKFILASRASHSLKKRQKEFNFMNWEKRKFDLKKIFEKLNGQRINTKAYCDTKIVL